MNPATPLLQHNFLRQTRRVLLAGVLAALVTACGPSAEPPPPTRTPAPTFTPTVAVAPVAVDANALATAQAAQQQQPVVVTPAPVTDPAAQPAGQPAAPAEAPIVAPTVAPTNTPVPSARVTLPDLVNIRSGPGTTFSLLGTGTAGQSFNVTGKNPAGDWWEIDYNGQRGWVLGQLVTASGTEAVAVAANIPVAPTLPPPPPATNTPVPPPPGPTATPVPPKSTYKFNVAVVGRCDRQPAGNWFEGKTYVNGVPQSGFKVVFSYAADAPWITQPQTTGPHEGYPGWDQGYYSHIISASNPIAGTWFVWVVDDAGVRISEIASWTSTGPGEGCNQAVVDFDSR